MRKLASVQRIDSVSPIDGADAIEVAHVNGWKVVVKKGEFVEGDIGVFFEIDSWVPHDLAPFLTKNGTMPKKFNDVEGSRLKTVKLRGQISQGLLINFETVREYLGWTKEMFEVGHDLTERLGVQKWEHSSEGGKNVKPSGSFPSYIRKTDQERVQNIKNHLDKLVESDEEFEITLKMDGSSMTVFSCEKLEERGVCSRNNMVYTEGDDLSNFALVSNKEQILDKLTKYCLENESSLAIQGELVGPGIQKNHENMSEHKFFVFDIFDIEAQAYLPHDERMIITEQLSLNHVPVIAFGSLKSLGLTSVDDILNFADNVESEFSERPEGVVFKTLSGDYSFKAISNKYLLKKG